jgi:hypothetical protein
VAGVVADDPWNGSAQTYGAEAERIGFYRATN